MPIMLDNLQANTPVRVFSPKFFDTKLTGSGRKTGVLNENKNPVNIDPGQNTLSENLSVKKRRFTNGQTEMSIIPLNILSTDGWGDMKQYKHPAMGDMQKIGTTPAAKGVKATELYLYMTPHTFILEETRLTMQPGVKGSGGLSKKTTACYQVFLFSIVDGTTDVCLQVDTMNGLYKSAPISGTQHNAYWCDFTCNPMRELDAMIAQLRGFGAIIDDAEVNTYINTYSLYDAMCKRSEEWQSTIAEFLDQYFDNVATNWASGGDRLANEAAYTLRRIEDYTVPLDLYRHIYKSIKSKFQSDVAVVLCKQNLNLLLSDTLNNLEQNKPNLACVPATKTPVPLKATRFSPEQQRAIQSTDPLVLVQAGAGTGKSTVILGRIDWMIASGVNPDDITVLSFTNAAADNITAKNDKIHSMTIARMIHTIYTSNFPDHELSTIDTIINSLDIYFPNTDVTVRFKDLCKAIIKNDSDGFTKMNNFVERHYDEVISMLSTIKQTALELEIIICYQQIENLVEPPEVQSRFLIIDEVQDNSIFEFIYTLKYVDKHRESLFIVGDCAQTLYEFRASNPKALNVLEGSGVFKAYQLQVNYRSNQEILDFANVALSNIEANQYANIQLRANSLQQVTEQSFTSKVKFKYYRLSKIADFHEHMVTIFANDLRPYINDCLARGQQVAFLAFTRNHVSRIQNLLTGMYPNKRIANLVPEKMFNTTVFSTFIKNYWDEVQFIPTQNIIDVITRMIIDRLAHLVFSPDKMQNAVVRMLDTWTAQFGGVITGWQQQYVNGQMTADEFLNNVKDCMLQFEIRNNSIRQALLSAKNQETKANQQAATADFVLSTIHSAKGLEFDNVVVIYRNDNDLAEDKKRMYYVAFTRAMQSEFVVAYDTVTSPKIEADYKTIIANLHKIAPIGSANGTMIANAKAILAAQQAGLTIQAINGVPECSALATPASDRMTPVCYLKNTMSFETIQRTLCHPVTISKVFDQKALVSAAEAIITDLEATLEQDMSKLDEDTDSEEQAS